MSTGKIQTGTVVTLLWRIKPTKYRLKARTPFQFDPFDSTVEWTKTLILSLGWMCLGSFSRRAWETFGHRRTAETGLLPKLGNTRCETGALSQTPPSPQPLPGGVGGTRSPARARGGGAGPGWAAPGRHLRRRGCAGAPAARASGSPRQQRGWAGLGSAAPGWGRGGSAGGGSPAAPAGGRSREPLRQRRSPEPAASSVSSAG